MALIVVVGEIRQKITEALEADGLNATARRLGISRVAVLSIVSGRRVTEGTLLVASDRLKSGVRP